MGLDNSLDAFYASIYYDLYADIADGLGIPVKEHIRDVAKVASRLCAEGLPFLTVTLPRIGKALDRALSSETPFVYSGIEKIPGTQLPKLFGWLFRQVFSDEGVERPDSNTEAIRALRQLMYLLYKLEIPNSEEKNDNVINQFVIVDEELGKLSIDDSPVITAASRLTSDVFGMFDHTDIRCQHGPGSVATGENPAEKHKFSRIYSEIEKVYPFTEYFQYSLLHVCDSYHEYQALEALEAGTAKVVLVPKDSRGPRLISCEPLEYQWIQQGLGRKISSHLERHRYTQGHVNFTDQSINRRLARESSLTQEWVTLDMKEASDRVSTQLVKKLFAHVPQLLDALLATRSWYTKLPDGRQIRMNKFAPMGSCLCFPVEAFVFYALAVGVLIHYCGYKRRDARKAVYVYGDDIIVRRSDYAALLQYFPTVGLMFNDSKCCTAGFFRESCGCDAHKGFDVTPVKLRSVWYHRRRLDISTIASYVSFGNEAYARGWYRLHKRIKATVESSFRRLPVTDDKEFGGLAWVYEDQCTRQQPPSIRTRWNRALHRREVWCCRAVASRISSSPDNWSTVLRRISAPDEYTLPGIYAVPHRSRPKWGWIAFQ